mmetsp:Transcript_6902/g.18045  ORF Transcript_6902/g.18045 Transcript_6902/m.18045 type:complete len:422 (+) Transcript_6902:229-1494(+)|eukprot:jgi/Tetstr1/423949/TSEL_014560.t1
MAVAKPPLKAAGRDSGGRGDKEDKDREGRAAVYAALVLAQVALSFGAAYLRLSLQAGEEPLEPVIFAMAREMLASPPLLLLSWYKSGVVLPPSADLGWFALLGLCLFLNQLFFLLGLQFSGVVVATCMQPSVPVFTVALAVLVFRTEAGSRQKLGGIFLAVGGAVVMVFGSSSGAAVGTDDTPVYGLSGRMLAGNACLLTNCLCASGFFITAKRLTGRHHAASVTAWAYCAASLCMLATAMATVPWERWSLPPHMLPALAYWVVVCSVGGYACLTWATSRLPASHVAASQCLQPFVGTLLGSMLLGEPITGWDLGALAILAGLAAVVTDKPRRPQWLLPGADLQDAEDGELGGSNGAVSGPPSFSQRRMSASGSGGISRASSRQLSQALSPPGANEGGSLASIPRMESDGSLSRHGLRSPQ